MSVAKSLTLMHVHIKTTKLNKTFRAYNARCKLVILVSAKHYWHASCDVFILNFSTLKGFDYYGAQLATTVCGATDPEDVIMMLNLTFDMLRVPKLFSFLIRLCFEALIGEDGQKKANVDAAADGAQHHGTFTSNRSDNFDIERWIINGRDF